MHLELLFARLTDYGVVISPSKCVFGVSSLDFLGHHIHANGISPRPDKVKAIQELFPPSSLRKLREFLGLITFYRRFIPRCATIVQPLIDLLSTKRNSDSLTLNNEALSAFKSIKTALANATLLTHPSPDAPYCLVVDASNVVVGGVLQQYISGFWKPISFFSKRLKPAESKYSTFGRELLAIYLSICHFRHCLEGREFYVLTVHKALTHALSASPDHYSPRETHHLDYVSPLTSDIRHIHGKENVLADALSQMDINAVQTSSHLDFATFSKAQKEDPELSTLQSSALHLKEFPLPFSSGLMLCDTSLDTPRPYVPSSFRRPVIDNLHGLSNPGIHTTQNLITHCYIWPSINNDICNWTQSCIQCQKAKVHRHTVIPIVTFSAPDARFDRIHIDIVGPLPPSNGSRYLLTCVDRFTRWPEAIPIPDISAKTVARVFVSQWISVFGVPSTVTTDCSTQFESSLFQQLTAFLSMKRIWTTSYHPCANGMVECFYQQLKSALKPSPDTSKWSERLPLILLGIRTTYRSDLDGTPAQLIYGTTLRLPGQFFESSVDTSVLDATKYSHRLQSAVQQLHPVSSRPQTTKTNILNDISSCSHVFVRHDAIRKPLQPPYVRPYKVLKRTNNHFTHWIGDKPETLSLD